MSERKQEGTAVGIPVMSGMYYNQSDGRQGGWKDEETRALKADSYSQGVAIPVDIGGGGVHAR